MTRKSGLSEANSDVVHEMYDHHFASRTIARRIGVGVNYVNNEITAYKSISKRGPLYALASMIF